MEVEKAEMKKERGKRKRGDEQKGKIKRERAKKEKPKGMKNQEKLGTGFEMNPLIERNTRNVGWRCRQKVFI